MSNREVVARFIDALETLQIPYMLVGAYSSNAYGIARQTKDADFVVSLERGDLTNLMSHLGEEFSLNRQMQLETITSTIRNVITHRPSKFEMELFRVGDDPFDQQRFQRRCRRKINEFGREAWLPTAEDVVIQKLRWQRRRDIDDAKNVLAVQMKHLDWEYLAHWTAAHGTQNLLNELREELAELDLEGETPSDESSK